VSGEKPAASHIATTRELNPPLSAPSATRNVSPASSASPTDARSASGWSERTCTTAGSARSGSITKPSTGPPPTQNTTARSSRPDRTSRSSAPVASSAG
jgi:hypothetical protein